MYLKAKETEATQQVALIISKGKQQGRVVEHVDSEQVAWMLVGCTWAEDSAYLMGIKVFQDAAIAEELANMTLESISIEG